ncbi:MAG TPA: TrmH family RNA methyltransferase, partial [Stellaceae bacterium]|nr:TrmH family RNA methyltransferase [Stellaceae bacterium]
MRTPQQPPGNTRRRRRPAAAATAGDNWLWGRHAVAAALANPARRWRRLVVPAVERDAAAALAAAAHAEHLGGGAAVDIVERATINRLLPQGAVHQGWALAVEPLPEPDFDEILRGIAALPDRAIIVVLDRVSDPHNVGAVLRTAAAFGAAAVVVAEHGAPPVTGVVAKAASGAL